MIYTIGGNVQKDILVGDALEIEKGVLDGTSALVVLDVSNPEIISCGKINFDTMEVSETIALSASWVTNVWRPV